MKLGSKELLRYSKQILLKNIGVAGQKKISNTKVLIIGVGGLGCPLAMYLANMGIGNIGLIDHDKIELSNLNRQILYTSKDLGKYKVIQAKKFLGLINKKIKVNILKKKFDEKNANNIITKYQIICDCTDNFT
jgi:molybdopterin/thiamine biosynthesis adenylyltransferase